MIVVDAVMDEEKELEPELVLVSKGVVVVLSDKVNAPVELELIEFIVVADTDDESTLERETTVDGEKTPVSVAI